jgi:hypothetical protein
VVAVVEALRLRASAKTGLCPGCGRRECVHGHSPVVVCAPPRTGEANWQMQGLRCLSRGRRWPARSLRLAPRPVADRGLPDW